MLRAWFTRWLLLLCAALAVPGLWARRPSRMRPSLGQSRRNPRPSPFPCLPFQLSLPLPNSVAPFPLNGQARGEPGPAVCYSVSKGNQLLTAFLWLWMDQRRLEVGTGLVTHIPSRETSKKESGGCPGIAGVALINDDLCPSDYAPLSSPFNVCVDTAPPVDLPARPCVGRAQVLPALRTF